MKCRIPTITVKDLFRLAIPIFDIAVEHPDFGITFTASACCGANGAYQIDTSQGDDVEEMGFFDLMDFLVDFSQHDTAGVNVRCDYPDGTSDVFGFFMAGGAIHFLDSERIEWAHTHCADCGEYIGKEEGTNYTDYQSFRAKYPTISDGEVEAIIRSWSGDNDRQNKKKRKKGKVQGR